MFRANIEVLAAVTFNTVITLAGVYPKRSWNCKPPKHIHAHPYYRNHLEKRYLRFWTFVGNCELVVNFSPLRKNWSQLCHCRQLTAGPERLRPDACVRGGCAPRMTWWEAGLLWTLGTYCEASLALWFRSHGFESFTLSPFLFFFFWSYFKNVWYFSMFYVSL